MTPSSAVLPHYRTYDVQLIGMQHRQTAVAYSTWEDGSE